MQRIHRDLRRILPRQTCLVKLRGVFLHPRIGPTRRQGGELRRINEAGTRSAGVRARAKLEKRRKRRARSKGTSPCGRPEPDGNPAGIPSRGKDSMKESVDDRNKNGVEISAAMLALNPQADPVQIILNSLVQYPLIFGGVGLLLLLNILHWLFKPAKGRRK
jgi:hypothetical protein